MTIFMWLYTNEHIMSADRASSILHTGPLRIMANFPGKIQLISWRQFLLYCKHIFMLSYICISWFGFIKIMKQMFVLLSLNM